MTYRSLSIVCSLTFIAAVWFLVWANLAHGAQPHDNLTPRQDVDLRWQTTTPTVLVGDVVEMRLYAHAASRDKPSVPFTGFSCTFAWDADILQLLGESNDGPYEWLYINATNGWLDYGDGGLEDFNGTWTDGSASWFAGANLNALPGCVPVYPTTCPTDDPYATLHGLHVLTLQFRVVGEGAAEVSLTTLSNPFLSTMVWARDIGGLEILNDAGTARVECYPAATPPVYDAADLDADGDVDLRDFQAFQNAFSGG